MNIIAKTTLKKIGLKAESHLHPNNVKWVDKTAQSITQRCQVSIHMASHKDHIWCDVLDIDAAHILLGRPWLFDLDAPCLGWSNNYEFKFNGKR